jgi:hypothetical protein
MDDIFNNFCQANSRHEGIKCVRTTSCAICARPYGEQIEHHLLEAIAVSPHRRWHARIYHADHLDAGSDGYCSPLQNTHCKPTFV